MKPLTPGRRRPSAKAAPVSQRARLYRDAAPAQQSWHNQKRQPGSSGTIPAASSCRLLSLALAEASRIDAQRVGREAPGSRELARGTCGPILLDQSPEMSAAAGWAARVAAFLGGQAFRFFNVRIGCPRFGCGDLLRMRKALSRRARLLLLADDDPRRDHEQDAFGFARLGRVP